MACGLDWFHDSLVEEGHQLPLAHALKWDVKVKYQMNWERGCKICFHRHFQPYFLVKGKISSSEACLLRSSTYSASRMTKTLKIVIFNEYKFAKVSFKTIDFYPIFSVITSRVWRQTKSPLSFSILVLLLLTLINREMSSPHRSRNRREGPT